VASVPVLVVGAVAANPDGTVHAAAKKSWFAVKTL